jgi:formylglycine-generating enzyme required for sulfatase activity
MGNTGMVSAQERQQAARADMIWIPGGTFRMGSDRHYPEEAPVHHASVHGFWIDRTPITNGQFKEFVRATGHVTFAETMPDLWRAAAHDLRRLAGLHATEPCGRSERLEPMVEAAQRRELATSVRPEE